MRKLKIRKGKSLSEKITALVSGTNNESSEDELDASAPRVIDFDDAYEVPAPHSTDFRKRNVKLLSEHSSRYKGEIASRKDIEHVNDPTSDFESEENVGNQQSPYINAVDDSETNLNNENIDDSESAISYEELEELTMTDDVKNENIIGSEDDSMKIEQGLSIQNQLKIWEKLLELRIQMQKILTKSNDLPNLQSIKDNENKTHYTNAFNETSNNVNTLITKLDELKSNLQRQFPEISERSSLKRKSLWIDDEAGVPPVKCIAKDLETNFNEFRPYRNAVLLKWDDRTKLLNTGGRLKSTQEEFDIIRKIENALKTRKILMNQSQRVSHKEEKVTNVYDDSDFYHHQLRELIEYKANTSANMFEMTKQYSELQKQRQKMKKKVDTRASKGRKLRYVVHNKLVNFMTPEDSSTWTEESRNELCKSLFDS